MNIVLDVLGIRTALYINKSFKPKKKIKLKWYGLTQILCAIKGHKVRFRKNESISGAMYCRCDCKKHEEMWA